MRLQRTVVLSRSEPFSLDLEAVLLVTLHSLLNPFYVTDLLDVVDTQKVKGLGVRLKDTLINIAGIISLHIDSVQFVIPVV